MKSGPNPIFCEFAGEANPGDLMNQDTQQQLQTVTVGHTPDMDDAFMFYAIAYDLIDMQGLKFNHVVEDIQALNDRAQRAELDMTAVSAASYPSICDKYAILSVGSSVGVNYGPLIISSTAKSVEDLKGAKIAVPGLQTTAYLLMRLAIDDVEAVPMPFSDIPQAVLDGKVDAGLVIHEWQLTYHDSGLLPIIDLGSWWHQQYKLPIPLGLNLINRRLSPEDQVKVATVFRNSILHSLTNQDKALEYAMQYARGTDLKRSRQFVGMYVNQDTLTFNEDCRKALEILYTKAFDKGLIDRIPDRDIIEPEEIREDAE